MTQQQKGVLALIFTAFLGGSIAPGLIRLGVSQISPFIFNFFRALGTLLLLTPIVFKHKHKFPKGYFGKSLVLGATIGGNFTFFALGITHTTLVASQLLYALVPILAPLIAFFWIKEELNSKKALGTGFALLGILTLIFFSRASTERLSLGSLQGNAVILIAVLSYSFYLVFSKKMKEHLAMELVVLGTYLGASIFLAPFALYMMVTQSFTNILLPQVLGAIAGMCVNSVLFSYSLQYAIKRVSTSTVAVSTLLGPEFAVLTGVMLFSEKITLPLMISMILVIVGIFLNVAGEPKTWWQRVRIKSSLFFSRFGL